MSRQPDPNEFTVLAYLDLKGQSVVLRHRWERPGRSFRERPTGEQTKHHRHPDPRRGDATTSESEAGMGIGTYDVGRGWGDVF